LLPSSKRAYLGLQKRLFRNPFKPILHPKRAYFAFRKSLFWKSVVLRGVVDD